VLESMRHLVGPASGRISAHKSWKVLACYSSLRYLVPASTRMISLKNLVLSSTYPPVPPTQPDARSTPLE
jgi:hypothetical protein